MFDRLKSEALFLEHLPWIAKVAAKACRHAQIAGVDPEDFTAWVQAELMKNDYAVFRLHRGESTLKTYLTAVVNRRFMDYCRTRLGRWRPSAMAERMGPPANELEALVYRDKYTLAQAGEKLRTAGSTTLSDTELARLLHQLPPRTPLRPVEVGSDAVLDAAPDPSDPDQEMADAEESERREKVFQVLRQVMDGLDPEDQMILRMHFQDGLTVADVARALGIEQKPLYRRLDRLRKLLRANLENDGIHRSKVREILGHGEEE